MEQRIAELEKQLNELLETTKSLSGIVQGLSNGMTNATTALGEFVKFAERHENNTKEIIKDLNKIHDNLAKLNALNNIT